jgi:hypothetical protein
MPCNISRQQAFLTNPTAPPLGASARPRNEGLKCNYAVHMILGHHHGLVLVESSDLASTEDR